MLVRTNGAFVSNELQTTTTRIHPGEPKQKVLPDPKPAKLNKNTEIRPSLHTRTVCVVNTLGTGTPNVSVWVSDVLDNDFVEICEVAPVSLPRIQDDF